MLNFGFKTFLKSCWKTNNKLLYLNKTKIMKEGRENPTYRGAFLCRMDNAYIKMCYWNGKEWLDMWKTTLEGSVNDWMEIPPGL